MGWTYVKEVLGSLQNLHFSEYGKIIQKLLALALQRMGYDHMEERSIQGVDIDVMKKATGERYAFEVKTSKSADITIAEKDGKGLESRRADGYETFYAILCYPLCFSEGWIIVPSQGIKKGRQSAMALLRRLNQELSDQVNSVYPEIIKEVAPELLKCKPGTALKFMKQKYRI